LEKACAAKLIGGLTSIPGLSYLGLSDQLHNSVRFKFKQRKYGLIHGNSQVVKTLLTNYLDFDETFSGSLC
jgi:hypothetical protein